MKTAATDQLLHIMARLRDPQGGCPWDQQQDYASIVRHTIEEAYEVAEAIEQGDFDELKDELGDLLFQVVFYAQLASEEGRFDFADVVTAICTKMLRRHPHVFGDEQVADEAQQRQAWERIKTAERASKAPATDRPSKLDNIPQALPALIRAAKLQKIAASIGFDWPDRSEVLAKVHADLAELALACDPTHQTQMEEKLGDLLFTCVNLSRHLNIDAETALRKANRTFERRLRALESTLEGDNSTLSNEPLDLTWEAIKGGENQA